MAEVNPDLAALCFEMLKHIQIGRVANGGASSWLLEGLHDKQRIDERVDALGHAFRRLYRQVAELSEPPAKDQPTA